MFLIDTDILIYSLKGNEIVNNNFKLYAGEPKAVSVISIGELLYGAYKSQRKIENLGKVHSLSDIFPVIDVNRTIMDTFAHIKADLSMNGIRVDDFDLLIGSTALSMNYTVVTNNEKHYSKIPGLTIDNWAKD